ncbi:hypothetical protein BpHYR1_010242 [Brachionus plicatilis]|uniref:Uncharacterized protein n=1 Tax=Brachionus plicatilis TaxID=10195 RepID=A0A3M7R106_BRAPC|nr:hypothetical protein BpHYR1_010242 [Brachionus plicatilis]
MPKCQSLSSEGPKHVLGGTENVSVTTIYKIRFAELKLWLYWWYKGCISCYNIHNMFWSIRTYALAFFIFCFCFFTKIHNAKVEQEPRKGRGRGEEQNKFCVQLKIKQIIPGDDIMLINPVDTH